MANRTPCERNAVDDGLKADYVQSFLTRQSRVGRLVLGWQSYVAATGRPPADAMQFSPPNNAVDNDIEGRDDES